jgi:hypothetical protein
MALTQDELGNWYDDGSTSSSDLGGSGLDFNFTGGESQDYDFTSSEALAGQGFLQDEVGNAYKLDNSGNLTFKDSSGTDFTYNADKGGFTDKDGNFAGGDNSLLSYVKKYGSKALDLLKTNGKFDPAKLATLGIGAYALTKGGSDTGGYNKPVPKMELTREQVQYAQDPNRAPGAMGRQYFTDPTFTPKGDAAGLAAAQTAAQTQASGLLAAAPKYAAPAPNPYAGKIPMAYNPTPVAAAPKEGAELPVVPGPEKLTAEGGIKMAKGGIADAGRYLRGKTDGMADEIETSIDEEQPALLSHGEFVIPADVVSHLGNGNSEAGAEKLYSMMDRIREARTGTKEQGKEIDADKFLPAAAGGLMAAYAGGGEVHRFQTGGSTVSGPSTATPTTTGAGGVPQDVSRTSTLSPWVGDYVTDALGQGAALANAPYQAYKGPLTAGASDLQQQAFAGASDIAMGGYTPGSFMGSFDATQANQYMNPYIQASLDPQLKELKRQSDIARLDDAGRLTRAGAFGGSRQAIMESEGRRNLLDKQANLIGQGYKTAFDTGASRFAADQAAQEKSRQFGADFGLQSVKGLADLGAVQRGITTEGLAADKKQFEEERDFAYNMPKYQLGLLSGLPIGSNTTAVNQDAISKMQSDIGGLASLYKTLAGLGVKK